VSECPVVISESHEVYLRDDGSTYTRKEIFVKLDVTFRDRMLKILKGPPLSVFLCISLHCDESMTAFPSVTTIENETGYSRPAVLAALDFLIQAGLVERQYRQKQSGEADSNLYTIRGFFTMGSKPDLPGVANVVSYPQLTTLATVANDVSSKKKPSKKIPSEEDDGAHHNDDDRSSSSAPTSPGKSAHKRDRQPPEDSSGLRDTAPPVDLMPQSDEERALFRLAAINTPHGPEASQARFQNAQQASDFRAAVVVLNGETVRVLEAFYRGGGGGIGKAVSYVCGAARRRQAQPQPASEYQPPMFFAPTSWEE